MRRSEARAQLKRNRMIAVIVGIAVICLGSIMAIRILSLHAQNQELEARKARLDEQILAQEQRQEELDDDEEYVRTTDYIEEKAKSIGYVYPDEIIFKRED